MSKFYAVKGVGIFNSWKECENAVKGVSGVKFKSFKKKRDAKDWLLDRKPILSDSSKINIYTDGSASQGYVGYGAWVSYKGQEFGLSGHCEEDIFGKYDMQGSPSNPVAEFLAFSECLEHFRNIKSNTCLVFHIDYVGVGNWMRGDWRAKDQNVKNILKHCKEVQKHVDMKMIIKHVRGHSGNYGNDKADTAAKNTESYNTLPELVKLLQ